MIKQILSLFIITCIGFIIHSGFTSNPEYENSDEKHIKRYADSEYNKNDSKHVVIGFTNSSGNLTAQQLQLMTNTILSGQRKYQPPQYNDLAKYISNSLGQLLGPLWTVYVWTNRSTDAAISTKSYLGKWAVLINVGTLKMSYAMIRLYRGQCQQPNYLVSNNQTRYQNYFSPTLETVVQKLLTDTVSSSVAYGQNMSAAAAYIQQKVIAENRYQWNVIISKPSTVSGAYSCQVDGRWGLFVGFADWKWNYITYEGFWDKLEGTNQKDQLIQTDQKSN